MLRGEPDRPSASFPLPRFRGVENLLGAAQALRYGLLCVFRRHAEVLGDLADAIAREIAEAEDVLIARRQGIQRFARRNPRRQRLQNVRREGVRALAGTLRIALLDLPSALPPAVS